MARPTPELLELLRLLAHARGCDGVRCATCRTIDLRLGDWPHSLEDPTARLERVGKALDACRGQAEKLYAALEGAPVPASYRRLASQLSEWIGQTRELLFASGTRGDNDLEPVQATVAVVTVQRTAAIFVLREDPEGG